MIAVEHRPHRPHRPHRDEFGQTTLLIVGFAVVLLFVVVVVIDSSAAFLRRQELDTVADGAALAGADAGSRNLEELYAGGVAGGARLDQAEAVAREAVARHLSAIGAHSAYPGLSFTVRIDPATDTVSVSVSAPVDLPLPLPGGPTTAMVSSRGSAAVVLDR